jgi:hypothetical protein
MQWKQFILAIFMIFSATLAHASFISIQSDPSVFIDQGEATAALEITNLGDAPAYSVFMTATCRSQEGSSEKVDKIQPGGSVRLKAPLGAPPAPDGIHTVVFTIHYKDSAGTRYSALHSLPLVTDLESPPKQPVRVTVENVTLDKRGTIHAEIDSPKEIENHTLSLFLPNEIRSSQKIIDMEKGSTSASFEIRNLTANQGSTYLAIIVSDYIQNGTHISKATPLNIKVASSSLATLSPALILLLVALIAASAAMQLKPFRRVMRLDEGSLRYLDIAILLATLCVIEVFILTNLQPKYLFMNTTTVGGDTPAHNYIASHLRDSLLGEGKIVSWAGGWWCGFPMLQFYFSLPYLCIVLLSLLLPFNIAFKLISVAGILALPIAAWGAGQTMRLPRPIPLLAALFTVPILFDNSHTMWGVNIYSTLAGMISNSMSFPLMLLFLASAWRDVEDQRFRARTVLLLVSVLASHFFTSIVGLLTVSIIPFLRPRRDMPKAMMILGSEIALGLLLMSWWLVPLIMKIEYTADFGANWNDIVFFKQLPGCAKALSPFLIPAAALLLLKRTRVVIIFSWMLLIAVVLFFFGFTISNVFVNVRLWPFIVYSVIMLEAIGLGYMLSLLPCSRIAAIPVTALILLFAIDAPNHVPEWTKWNFEGLESKDNYAVFEKLVLPLEGTPGRLANDLCDENNMLGSSRIFELAPHLTGKPILEGGIVSSAAGAMFSYYIQGETSQTSAGFPTNVMPTSFNITNATKHLELFNVKHFIARWETTRKAMHEHKDWRFVGREQEWELFELMSHDGTPVFVPPYMPIALHTRAGVMDWKTAGLEWIYNIASFSNHFVIVPELDSLPKGMQSISAKDYLAMMKAKDPGLISELQPKKLPTADISIVEHSDSAIEFSTSQPGIPHIIKSTWYPNWKSTGGERIYMVTPCFMMITPSSSKVRIVYGRTGSDIAGIILTLAGLTFLLALSARSLLNGRRTS